MESALRFVAFVTMLSACSGGADTAVPTTPLAITPEGAPTVTHDLGTATWSQSSGTTKLLLIVDGDTTCPRTPPPGVAGQTNLGANVPQELVAVGEYPVTADGSGWLMSVNFLRDDAGNLVNVSNVMTSGTVIVESVTATELVGRLRASDGRASASGWFQVEICNSP